jgi:mono/diheme cytochrome c family protein
MSSAKTLLFTLSAVAVTAVAACGGGADKAPASDAMATPEAAPAAAPAAVAAVNMDSIGKEVYVTCTTCHQANGQGVPNTYPPLAGSDIVAGDANRVIAIVLHGLMGPVKVNGKEYNNVMSPWGAAFNDTQVAAVVSYVRTQWGNTASAVTAADVAKVRAATSSRATMWTWDELTKATF